MTTHPNRLGRVLEPCSGQCFKACKRRVAAIKKKAMELALLCDIPVCVVIMGPNGEVQTWPENQTDVQSVLDKYVAQEKVRTEKDDAKLVKILDSKIDAIKTKIENLLENGATDVAKIENPQKILDVIDLDQVETENPENFLDVIDLLDQDESENSEKILDVLDLDLDIDLDLDHDDEKNSIVIELAPQEEPMQNGRSVGSGFSDWDDFSTDSGKWEGNSTDFDEWDRLCADWEKSSGDFGEWEWYEISSVFVNGSQFPNDPDSDKLPQLQNSDFVGTNCENPLPTGYETMGDEFPQLPLEAMDISMTELLLHGDFLTGDFGSFEFPIDMAGF